MIQGHSLEISCGRGYIGFLAFLSNNKYKYSTELFVLYLRAKGHVSTLASKTRVWIHEPWHVSNVSLDLSLPYVDNTYKDNN